MQCTLGPASTVQVKTTPHPGQLIKREFLDPMGITPTMFAALIGVPEHWVTELLAGRREICPLLAAKLAGFFDDTGEEMWLQVQYNYNLKQRGVGFLQ